jgi:diketogulonate reductase-like aldo/keto reductase
VQIHWPIDQNSMAHFAGHFTADGGRDYATTGEVAEAVVPPTTSAFNQLMQLQREGKVKHIGTSNFGVSQLTEAMATGAKISVNQVRWWMTSHDAR